MNPTTEEQTRELLKQEGKPGLPAKPVDIGTILMEMGKAHLRESVDVDLQNWC
jgi:hypothetical protein